MKQIRLVDGVVVTLNGTAYSGSSADKMETVSALIRTAEDQEAKAKLLRSVAAAVIRSK